MTVTYTAEVATSKGFGCFWKLLFRWRGSIYKLLWPDLILYCSFYFSLSVLYRLGLNENQKRYFEKVALYCSTYGDLIPVSFVLGFYVALVVKRWWDSFNCIPWPDSLAFFVSAFLHGQDERGRLMRRTIMRYINLALVFTFTLISPCVKKRFPTMDHLVEAGILLPNEKKIIEQMKTTHSTYWMPLVWASSIATRARKEGRIRDDFALKTVIDAIAHYRSLCGGLLNYDWITIPLVYTQVVTLVVYTFFLATLMGRQYLDPTQGYSGNEIDLYLPIFNFLQFFFYMGWLKVAETLVNPFGEDDDDFELNWVIDRDIQVSYLIVDEMHQEHPELIKDQYWDDEMPDLPYTAAAMPFYSEPPKGSAETVTVAPHEAEFVPLETLYENEEERLDEVKVGEPIPVAVTEERSRLSRNLSESSHSTISGLGRSFHPHSYQQKNIMTLLHRLFSRENANAGSNISLHSGLSKAINKRGSKESNVCATPSSPPSPSDSRYQCQLHEFPDDIFHLSDLSLAESRATSCVQSPGTLANFHPSELLGQSKNDSASQHILSKSSPTSKIDSSDDESKSGTLDTKHRSRSLRRFFRNSGKLKSSQKSLVNTSRSNLRHISTSTANTEDNESIMTTESIDESIHQDNRNLDPADSQCKEFNKNLFELGKPPLGKHKVSTSLEIPKSSPITSASSENEENSMILEKEPSTHTLIASEENDDSSSSNDLTEKIDINEKDSEQFFNSTSVDGSNSRKNMSSLLPKRAISLLIHSSGSKNDLLKGSRPSMVHSHEVLTDVERASDSDSKPLKERLKLKKQKLYKKLSRAPKAENGDRKDKSSSYPNASGSTVV